LPISTIASRDPIQVPRNGSKTLRATCEGLGDFPFASALTGEPNVRRVPLVRFPYTIFYRIDSLRDVVEIARILHGARVRNLGRIPDSD
jgi:plasmid stabilization system protein ParE